MNFILKDGCLTVQRNLDAQAGPLGPLCEELLSCGREKLVLDVSRSTFISSRYFADFRLLAKRARDEGRHLVIRAPAHLRPVFEIMGLPEMAVLAPPPAAAGAEN